ncbi:MULTISPECIES: invasion associated locus B family protein [Rhizobium]|uniref:Invasion protein IalB n=1 Tax=Rhizobium esperanzae TaxID=1967781 RepID=A0A7W6UL43_9HYPH|nr:MULTISPECIES: invasion associated locus B family protein [Rhizobium]MBB4440208.1 invasion protein IalB [Rhizobium esperanzae]MDH6202228.1 invasion protein IalB [Rhizobium leguminosarum]
MDAGFGDGIVADGERTPSGGLGLRLRLASVFALFLSGLIAPEAAEPKTPDEPSWKLEPGYNHVGSLAPSAAAPIEQLLVGADGIKEKYDDWGVECTNGDVGKQCAAGQFHEDPKSGVIVFAIQVYPSEQLGTRVLIRMPLGLRLSEGVRLELDTQPSEQHADVATCLPEGCVVLLIMSEGTIDIMKAAQVLTVSAISFASGGKLTFRISLKGFPRSLKRLEELQ